MANGFPGKMMWYVICRQQLAVGVAKASTKVLLSMPVSRSAILTSVHLQYAR